MSPDAAHWAIELQARTYARRVLAREINDSAVEGLLAADARAFCDSCHSAETVFSAGLIAYRRLTSSPPTSSPQKEDGR